MRPRRAWTPNRGPRPTRTPPTGRTRIRVVHPRAPALARPQFAVTAPVPAGEEGGAHRSLTPRFALDLFRAITPILASPGALLVRKAQ